MAGALPRDQLRLLARLVVVHVAAALLAVSSNANGETISQALMEAYKANPDLNQQRALVRATDENVGRAVSGFRPRISATLDAGVQYTREGASQGATTISSGSERQSSSTSSYVGIPRGVGLQVEQTLFDGSRTFNSVRQAESQVFAARETMRLSVQNTLFSAASNYMNVLRDTAILNLRRSNVVVLLEQLRGTRDRREAGEVNQSDLAQVVANLAAARSDFYSAQANLQASIAGYRQVVGREPKRLEPAQTLERLLPRRLSDAVAISQVEHPAIVSALHDVDTAALAVKVAEGVLYPTVTLNGNVSKRADLEGMPGYRSLTASLIGQVSIPLYQGGDEYASIRQAKGRVSQSRFYADLQRDQVRAALVSAWGELEAAKAQIASGQAAVAAAELALYGIREEARAGQRTTFDILTAQRALLNARVGLVVAQRDRVVGSYSVLASMGRLSVTTLSLKVDLYDPTIHFDQVKDKPFGVRTPDGR